jgi:hypothetical protein
LRGKEPLNGGPRFGGHRSAPRAFPGAWSSVPSVDALISLEDGAASHPDPHRRGQDLTLAPEIDPPAGSGADASRSGSAEATATQVVSSSSSGTHPANSPPLLTCYSTPTWHCEAQIIHRWYCSMGNGYSHFFRGADKCKWSPQR